MPRKPSTPSWRPCTLTKSATTLLRPQTRRTHAWYPRPRPLRPRSKSRTPTAIPSALATLSSNPTCLTCIGVGNAAPRPSQRCGRIRCTVSTLPSCTISCQCRRRNPPSSAGAPPPRRSSTRLRRCCERCGTKGVGDRAQTATRPSVPAPVSWIGNLVTVMQVGRLTNLARRMVRRWLMKFPIVFAVSIVWPSTTVGGTELKAFGNIIPHELDLGQIFHLGGDAADLAKEEAIYVFRGMVCYYGLHYVSFFQSQSGRNEWYLFDDVQVHRIGTWEEVRRRIERGCYQPTILYWEKNQLKFDQLETLAQQVHLAPTSPRPGSPHKHPPAAPVAPSAAPLPLDPLASAVKLSPPKPGRPKLACQVFTSNVASISPKSPPLAPEQVESLAALDTLEALDEELQTSSPTRTSQATSPPSFPTPHAAMLTSPRAGRATPPSSWEILRAPADSSPDGVCRYIVRLTAEDGGLGLVVGDHQFSNTPTEAVPPHLTHLTITELEAPSRNSDRTKPPLPAVACGVISVGDFLLQVDREAVDTTWTPMTAMERLVTASGPITLTLARLVPWSCTYCTLINDVGATECAACDRPKQKIANAASPKSQEGHGGQKNRLASNEVFV
ncbi:hypothetical protein, variant [Aphanomyces invadans]|uniref:RanBP2-type domain-containing protein n=1 Tax=Aphanomyces invadans TaxID=157072 RepID=A0A024UEK6_9STRA|nr:hypothetical protein, variant [Aphanomyces invadans]ETW04709.1 hypothetical protein, variant [Aphanomyces invadans]|eukprot:XP_008866146.1 hypothetical protein, variant [Aphanomyces invadans]